MIHNPRTCNAFHSACENVRDAIAAGDAHPSFVEALEYLDREAEGYVRDGLSTCTCKSPGGDEISRTSLESVGITVYRSPNDYAFVVEIDTQPDTGEVRVYVNDGQIFAADPEVG